LTFKHTHFSKNIPPIDQDLPSYEECKTQLRVKINEYLIEKKETEMKTQLYKSDMRDAPWDYYKILDAEWWMKALQTCKITHSR
jgi:hypothetical protein